MSDFRSALRHLVKSPGFAVVAIATLALALGVNSAIFSIVNGLVLRPTMPREPDRVVSVFTAKQKAERDYRQFSYQEFQALQAPDSPFAEVTAIAFAVGGIGDTGEVHRALTFFTSENFFSFAGARPAAGRFFTAEETTPGARIPVAVASYQTWQRHGGRPDFVGSAIRINGRPHTVIGVAPKGFAGVSVLFSPEVWLPLGLYGEIAGMFGRGTEAGDLNNPANYALNLTARLHPGASLESTRAMLPIADARLNALLPGDGDPRALQIAAPSRLSVSTEPSDEEGVALIGSLLMGMAGIVLLIASLNLANLHLARGAGRTREIAVRLAIGATRWQIVRQLTIEGLILAMAGGVVGLLLCSWVNAVLVSSFQTMLSSVSFSLSADLQPDFTAFAATFGFCLLSTLVFSVGPAWRASRADLVHDLKVQAGEPAAVRHLDRFFAGRHLLVMGQMALSLVLVFSAGLFLRAALHAGGMNLGFEPRGAIIAGIDYSLTQAPADEAHGRILAAMDRVRALPGVEAVGLTTLLPYGNISQSRRLAPAEVPSGGPDSVDTGVVATNASITPGYLASLGAGILRGRDFTEQEGRTRSDSPVAIVDEGLARQLFGDEEALGRQVRFSNTNPGESADPMTIVGIVSRHRQDLQDREGPAPRLYVPLGQDRTSAVFLCVRYAPQGTGDVAAEVPVLRRHLLSIDPQMPIIQLEPFADVVNKSFGLWFVRLGAVMFGVFGAISLVLATVGVYGVKAYTVARRTREIGIRMALGARRRDVYAIILRQAALQILIAGVVGLALSLLLGQALAQMLYGVSPTDPLVLAGAALILGAAALMACWVPARRAAHVNPTEALRAE